MLFYLLAALFIYAKINYPTATPLQIPIFFMSSIQNPHAQLGQQVIGFLPYWRLDDSKYLHFDLLSEVIFFSLTSDENGEIVKVIDNETEPGWRWWNNQSVRDLIAKTKISGGKFSLTIAMQKNKTLESFLDNKAAQENLINNLLKIIKSDRLDGLNLDFEYAGDPGNSYREKYTEFAQNLTARFRKYSPKTKLSVDVYPLSIRKPRMIDIARLTPLFDQVIVMSYDYYSVSSDVAGPVAPIAGYKEGKYFFDIQTTYEDYLKIVPKEKIVMGVPYYGWDFPVEEANTPMSPVLPKNDENGYPAVMSYGRMRSDRDIIPENCRWENLAKSTWCSYTDPESNIGHQVWIEDNKSIETKFDFAKENDFGGIAIWTLGYDKNYPDLWKMIADKFTKD